MTPKKIAQIVQQYSALLQQEGITPRRIDPNSSFANKSPCELLEHALYLCEQLPSFVFVAGKFGKANRHLTAIQMCLSFADRYTLNELRAHNRPD